MADEAQPEQVAKLEFKCKGCGANLQYAPGTATLRCPYCGAENPIEVSGKAVAEHDLAELDLVAHAAAQGFGTATREFKCDRCGALTSLAGSVTATRCAFCGSDVVVPAPPVEGMVRPESLIPFAITKEQAIQKYREWLRKRYFAPGKLKQAAGLAQIDGLYIPHFTFDANAFSRWGGEAGHYYYRTETRMVDVNGKMVNQPQQVREVRWEHRSGTNSAFYDDELVCASRGLPHAIIVKIQPWGLKTLVPYAPEYLSGFAAEAYSVTPKECWRQAAGAMTEKERAACSQLLDGDTQRGLSVNTAFSNPKWKHILLPAYVSAYVFGPKTYRFMVNGQTGEVQGEAPISWIKVLAVAGLIIALLVLLAKLASGSP